MHFSLNNYLFGPLDIEYCVYFYFLSVMQFLICIFILAYLAFSLIFGSKKFDAKMIGTTVFGALLYGVIYFQNRLLHSMCVRKEGMEAVIPHQKGTSFKKNKT